MALRLLHHSRHLTPALVRGMGAALVKGTVAAQLPDRRHHPRDLWQHRALAASAATQFGQACNQTLGVRVKRLLQHLICRALSITRPAYMTITRSAISATAPMSCVIITMAVPRSACS